MTKKNHIGVGPIAVVTIQPEFGDSSAELHKVLVSYLLGQMKPIEGGTISLLTPRDYDESDMSKKGMNFDSHFDKLSGRHLFFVRRSRLVKVTAVKYVVVDDKTYYLAAKQGKYIIINSQYTKAVDSKVLGFFVYNNQK